MMGMKWRAQAGRETSPSQGTWLEPWGPSHFQTHSLLSDEQEGSCWKAEAREKSGGGALNPILAT